MKILITIAAPAIRVTTIPAAGRYTEAELARLDFELVDPKFYHEINAALDKIAAIKELRHTMPGLGLADAKTQIEGLLAGGVTWITFLNHRAI